MRICLEQFSNLLEGVPRDAEHSLIALPSVCGTTHPESSQLELGQEIVEASHVTLHQYLSCGVFKLLTGNLFIEKSIGTSLLMSKF